MGIFKQLGKVIAMPIRAAKEVVEGVIEEVTEGDNDDSDDSRT
jgi:hypothetical protein